MGRRGREIVATEFTVEHVVAQTLGAYAELLARPGVAPMPVVDRRLAPLGDPTPACSPRRDGIVS